MTDDKLLNIEGEPGYKKDPKSKAILCTDNEALKAYRSKRSQHKEIKDAIERINGIQEDMTELKNMIKPIINQLKANGSSKI